jgi:dihydrolipoamide dehydrogenase
MATAPFDLVVIGGGPGGYVAALRAAQLGLRTALVEREHLGGICLNWGCIPTKSLLHTADTLRRIRHAGELGLKVGTPEIDFAAVMRRSRQVADRLGRGVAHLLKKAGVTVFMGRAALTADRQVEVVDGDGRVQRLQATHKILATGARPRALPSLPFDSQRIWHYRDALAARSLPRSLLVIGAGAIGMEFASFYATLGTQVTLVEALPRVLPGGDADVSAFVQQAFERDGIAVRTDTSVESANVEADGVRIALQAGAGPLETLVAERVLVAIGLVGNTEQLGLEHTRVQVERGQVVADGWGVTAEPGVYAIGDLVGAPMLAHKASHDAMACVERIAGLHADAPEAHALVPACVYSHPQSASVGLTEGAARERGHRLRVGRFPLEGNGKAIAIGEAAGFVKTVFDADSGALLGAHLVGPEATELIHGFTLAGTLEATEAELIETVFPHPTLSEAMHESVLAAFGRALHI